MIKIISNTLITTAMLAVVAIPATGAMHNPAMMAKALCVFFASILLGTIGLLCFVCKVTKN